MQLSFDIGSFCLGLITAVIVPMLLWLLRRSERAAAEERAKEARERETRRAEYELKQQRYNEVKEALEVHASLTSREVLSAREHADSDEVSRQLIVAAHQRATLRFNQLSDDFELDEKIADAVAAAVDALHQAVPDATAEGQDQFDAKFARKQKQDHRKNARVQARMSEFVAHLAGGKVERGESAPVSEQFRDLFESVRLTKAGQAARITLPASFDRAADAPDIWFAGNNKGVIPEVLAHTDTKNCTLSSARAGSVKAKLRQQTGSGADLADAFAHALRELAAQKEVCGCGTPLRVR